MDYSFQLTQIILTPLTNIKKPLLTAWVNCGLEKGIDIIVPYFSNNH